MTNKWNWVAGIAALLSVVNLFLVFLWAYPNAQQTFGSVGVKLIENYDPYVRYNGGINTALPFKTTSTMQIGTNGVALNGLNPGTCYIQPYATTIAATTTAQVDCQGTAAVGTTNTANDAALSGVAFGDFVTASLSTTTAASGITGGLSITGVSASTTAGYITLRVLNLTGATYTWPTTGFASGTVSYFDAH